MFPLIKNLFVLLVLFFALKKLSGLMYVVLLVYFHFCCLCFWCEVQKITSKTNVMEITIYVYSRSFMVLGFVFKSSSHFELIFVYGVREWASFILLHIAVQFSQHHLLKRLSLPHCIFLPPLSKIRYP